MIRGLIAALRAERERADMLERHFQRAARAARRREEDYRREIARLSQELDDAYYNMDRLESQVRRYERGWW